MNSMSGPEMIVSACIFGIMPLAVIIIGFLVHKEKSRERLLAIEKGVSATPASDDRNLRMSGTVLLALGIGLLIMLVSLNVPRGTLGLAAIPTLLGVALLLEYRARMREKLPPG